jgi:hypothetical protein
VWVPGCATGEEAYSLAIVLIEHAQGQRSGPIQIFASDVDEEALDFRPLRLYSESIAADVPRGRWPGSSPGKEQLPSEQGAPRNGHFRQAETSSPTLPSPCST